MTVLNDRSIANVAREQMPEVRKSAAGLGIDLFSIDVRRVAGPLDAHTLALDAESANNFTPREPVLCRLLARPSLVRSLDRVRAPQSARPGI